MNGQRIADAGERSLARTWREFAAGRSGIAPVYVAGRVVREVTRFLAGCVPDEGIAKLFGYSGLHEGMAYAKVTDWFTGDQIASRIGATFTDAGLREIERARADRYPVRDARPLELGIVHSHPFGYRPAFSATDIETFTTYPYGPENVHLLIDPTAGFVRVYIGVRETDGGGGGGKVAVVPVRWVAYEMTSAGVGEGS